MQRAGALRSRLRESSRSSRADRLGSAPDRADGSPRTPFSASGRRLPEWQREREGVVRTLIAVHGDITTQRVDAIVNAANRAMRGGGGVDGAIHRAGGPAILDDCVRRFPRGLHTGDAGWSTAGNLPTQWVVHTVGPDYGNGERDRSLLVSCYHRSLEVADELGARSLAFPLISAGVYRWPLQDAIDAAVVTLSATPTAVEEIRLVALDPAIAGRIRARIEQAARDSGPAEPR